MGKLKAWLVLFTPADKSSYPIWEDFITKAGKLQSQLRATVVAVGAFLDAFQKVADLATNSRGKNMHMDMTVSVMRGVLCLFLVW
ncbi:hypothetical protein INR49_012777 [Caranx melampygus]|nr:hypothetical protein INR49_012777 [Caranx melampygus]